MNCERCGADHLEVGVSAKEIPEEWCRGALFQKIEHLKRERDSFKGNYQRVLEREAISLAEKSTLLLQIHELKAALFAECRGIACAREGCFVGYRSCSGCEERAKKAHGPGWGDFVVKRKDESCENCGRPDRACEEHGKPIGVSKASGPEFCGECLAVLPCQAHCAHDWSASAGQVCAKCGKFRIRG